MQIKNDTQQMNDVVERHYGRGRPSRFRATNGRRLFE